MPKSKRDKAVSLTKVKKKGRDAKEKLVEEVRSAVDKFDRIFLFDVANMRSSKLGSIRRDWRKDSRIFFGKNKIIQLAFGRIPEESYAPNLHRLSKHVQGQCGVLCTNKTKEEVVNYFSAYREPDYARAGNVSTQTVELSAGPLEQFPFSMEPQLRKLGLPTSLEKGIVTLLRDHIICRENEVLKPEQARILKLLGHQLVDFQVNVRCCWTKQGGKFANFDKPSKAKANAGKEMDEVMEEN